MKRAFITGIEGQDGSYLAELLLGKGYEVHGIFRRSSNGSATNLKHLKGDALFLCPAELDEADSVRVPLEKSAPGQVATRPASSPRNSTDSTPSTSTITAGKSSR